MSWDNDHFKPVSWGSKDKEENWAFKTDLHTSNSSTPEKDSGNYWGYSSAESSKESSWAYGRNDTQSSSHFSPPALERPGSNPSSSWAYSTDSNASNNQNGHWGYQQGWGTGDSHGFGHDAHVRHLEGAQRSSFWGSDNGSSWHFSNAHNDLDNYHALNNARQRAAANSHHSESWGFSQSQSLSSAPSPSSFNPFSADSKKKNWG